MNIYLTLKALHLIAVISWMAGLLYLPRIFVYHVENKDSLETCEIFKVMERKLYFYIIAILCISTLLNVYYLLEVPAKAFFLNSSGNIQVKKHPLTVYPTFCAAILTIILFIYSIYVIKIAFTIWIIF